MEFKLSRIKNISLMFIAALVLAACGGAPSGGSQLVSEIEITLGATSIEADGVSSVAVRAEVKDQDDKAISGATVTFSSSLGSLSSTTAITDVNGIAQVALIAASTTGAANVTVSASGFNASETITFTSVGGAVVIVDGSQLVSSIVVTTGSSTIVANSSDTVAVRAVVKDQDGVVISGVGVTFNATLGSLSATTVVTNENGIAQVILTAESVTGASAVTASSNGYNAIGSVTFLSTDGVIGSTRLVSSIAVTFGASSIVANDTDTVALRAVVRDQDGNAISGATVTFDSELGSLSALTAATDENGIAQVTLTAGSVAGASAVRVTSAGFNASGTVTLLSVGGATGNNLVVSSVSITLGASSITANGSDTLAVRAIVEDQNDQAISGETVTFGSSLGSLSSVTFVTDENGFAQVTLTAGTVAGASGITATAAGFNASSTVTFLSTATPILIVDDVSLTLGASSLIANGSDEIVVRATVTDQNNDPLAGVNVSFSSTLGVLSDAAITTDLNGIAQVTLTAGTVSGVSDVRISAAGFNVDANVTFSPVAVILVVDDIALTLGSNTIVAGGTSVAVRATVRDQNGDLLNGAAVTFTATSGTLDSASATTNEDGIAEVSLTSSTITGTSTVTVSTSGFSESGAVTFIPGPVTGVNLLLSVSSVFSSEASDVSAVVTDANGNAVTNELVTFSFDASGSGSPSLSSVTATTNSNGVAAITYTAGDSAGTDTLRARTSNNSNDTANLTVTVETPVVDSIALTIGAESIVADGSDSVAVRATVRDENGDLLSGAAVTFTATSGTLDSASATTNEDGIAEVSLTSSTITGTSTVTVSTSGFSESGAVTFIPGPVTGVNLLLSVSSVFSSEASDVSAVVTDANGNAVTNELVTFSFDASGSGSPSLSSVTATTNSNGVAAITYTAGDSAGTDTLRARTSNNSNDTANLTITVENPVVDSIALTIGAESIVADGAESVAVRATVRDQNGDLLNGATVTFTATSGTLDSASATTNEDGIAEVSLTSSTITGTSTVTASTSGFSEGGTVAFIPGPATGVSLLLSVSSVFTSETSDVSAVVTDANGNVVTNELVTFSFDASASGSPSLSPVTAATNSNGIASTTYTAGIAAGTDTIRARTSNNSNDTTDLTVTVETPAVSSIELTVGAASIVADGLTSVAIRATVLDIDGGLVVGETVSFASTLGALSAATDTTDENGIAEVLLTSGTLTGVTLVTVSVLGFSDDDVVSFTAGVAANLSLLFSPSSVVTSGSSSISAVVTDVNGNSVAGETVTFSFDSEGSGSPALSSLSVSTNTDGIATTSYTAGNTAGTDTVAARTTNNVNDTADATVAVDAVVIGSVVISTGASGDVIADGATDVAIRATVLDVDSNAVEGEVVTFFASSGSLSSTTATTNTSGLAEVTLTSGTTPALALLTSSISGFSDSLNLSFVAGPPSVGSSVISGSPASVPADGTSTSSVTVLLVDGNNNLVADGTSVTLQTSAGSITTSTTATTSSGRASFTLQASSVSETASLSITQYPGITGSVEFGATGTGTATSVSATIVTNFLTIAGVGGVDNTTITISVTDDAGVLVSDPGVDNIRISFLTNPGGGEFISVGGASSTTTIDARTESGSVTLNLQAGTLPGAVELQILVDSTGVFASPEVTSLIPQISIASGPPETIVLSTPITNSITNLGGGFYRRSGTLIVTDRFGNAVPDGTAINLGLVDSVIVDSDSGQLTGTSLTDTAATFSDGSAISDFSTASIVRNSSNRFVEQGDRLLVTDVIDAVDKVRFVGSTINVTDLDVQSAYVGSETGLDYVIGAALLGGEISGVDSDSNLTTGSVLTESGLASIRVTYPANISTIRIGCFEVQDDLRYSPNDSARVFMVASATSGSATLVDEGTLCFAPISGFTLTSDVDTITSAGVFTATLTLRDGGDTIPLPFYGVNCVVEEETDGVGTFNVTATDGFTDINGQFSTTITVTNGVANDAATVTCRDVAGEDTVDISVDIP